MSSHRKTPMRMVRDPLAGFPVYDLPAGYTLRGYRAGDEQAWTRIHEAADRYGEFPPDRFAREFGNDPHMLSLRQFYLLDRQGEAVGTATAWFTDAWRGKVYGLLHWIAIHPDSQGKGLSKPLLSRVCGRMLELSYQRALLNTNTIRKAAIGLYRHFGFIACGDSASDAPSGQPWED